MLNKLNNFQKIFFAVLLTAISSQFLFFFVEGTASLGIFIFSIIVLACYLYCLDLFEEINLKQPIVIIALISYLIINFGIIISTKDTTLTIISSIILIPLIGVMSISNEINKNFVKKFFSLLKIYIFSKILGVFDVTLSNLHKLISIDVSRFPIQNSNSVRYLKIIKLLVFIGIPLLFVIIALLSSASSNFSSIFTFGFQRLNLGFFLSSFGQRLLMMAFICWFMLSEIYFIKLFSKDRKNIEGMQSLLKVDTKKDIAIALTIITFVLSFVYIIFLMIQIQSDFASLGSELSQALKTKYIVNSAPSRFFEILAVALINTSLIYYARDHFRQITLADNPFVKKLIRFAVALLTLTTILLTISAAIRIIEYIDTYGFTYKRLYGMLSIPVIITITLSFATSIFSENFKKYFNISLASVLIFAVIIIAPPWTYLISSINYSLFKDPNKERIADPFYTVPVSRNWSDYGQSVIENDIHDLDGLPYALMYNTNNYSPSFKRFLDLSIENFNYRFSKNKSILNFNFMELLIKNSLDKK